MRIELKILLPADIEQRKLLSQFSRYFSAEMLVCLGREYSSPRTALNEAELEKIRLVHVLYRVGIFVYRGGDRVRLCGLDHLALPQARRRLRRVLR